MNATNIGKNAANILREMVRVGTFGHAVGSDRRRKTWRSFGGRDLAAIEMLERAGLLVITTRNVVHAADARYVEIVARPTLAAHTVAAMLAA